MNLRELLADNDAAIIDTCVWCGPLNKEHSSLSRRQNPEYYRAQAEFIAQARTDLRDNPVGYITQGVFEELTGKNIPYKKLIKSFWLQRDSLSRQNLQERMRANKSLRRVIHHLYREDKCLNYINPSFINFAPSAAYETLAESVQQRGGEELLSKADLELLVSAATLAHEGMITALVSDDFAIMRVWKHMLLAGHEGITPHSLRFYIMPEFNEFKELYEVVRDDDAEHRFRPRYEQQSVFLPAVVYS